MYNLLSIILINKKNKQKCQLDNIRIKVYIAFIIVRDAWRMSNFDCLGVFFQTELLAKKEEINV